MKDTIMKILFTAFAISAVVYFILSTSGLQGDTKAIQKKSSNSIERHLIP